jgi:hypothetical protein
MFEYQWAIIRANILCLELRISMLSGSAGDEMDIDQLLESEDVEEGMDASSSSAAPGGVVCSQKQSSSNPLDGLSTSAAVAFLQRKLGESNPGTSKIYPKFLADLEIDAV